VFLGIHSHPIVLQGFIERSAIDRTLPDGIAIAPHLDVVILASGAFPGFSPLRLNAVH
jgi:hypothetical protein